MEIRCLKAVVQSGSRRYPLFVGFLPAEDIAAVSEAPSFRASQPHEELASNVLRPPVKDWQRPLDEDRVATIRTVFDDQGALMPNPVLLSANGDPNDRPQIRQETLNGETPTNAWIVTVPEGRSAGSKPLWILDGQHRINGLADSAQRGDDVPVVLLLNDDLGESYRGSDFASLFAQVTTTAKKLDELHNAWLTFAYELDEYANDFPSNAEHRAAMKTVCVLCERDKLESNEPNPFHNAIRFNPERQAAQTSFAYGCKDLKELVRKNYFADAEHPLDPRELADAVGGALRALRAVVPAPQGRSVFFGSGDDGQVAMQDAFMIGVLAYIKQNGVPDSWEIVLKGLQFHTTDWKFRAWVRTLGGKAGSDSRSVAQRVFTTAFRENQLPIADGDEQNLADYLRGNRAQVRVHFSRLNADGRAVAAGRQTVTLRRGEDGSREVGDLVHVRIDPGWRKTNIARLDVIDATSNVANPRKVPELLSAGGLRLPADAQDRELQVAINMVFYGGRSADAKIAIRW